MDHRLTKRLQSIEKQIAVVYEAEGNYLTLESAKEHILANLTIEAEGASQAAKDTAAKATAKWSEFRSALALAESVFHKEKHLLELKNNAWQAEYLTMKVESECIKKQK